METPAAVLRVTVSGRGRGELVVGNSPLDLSFANWRMRVGSASEAYSLRTRICVTAAEPGPATLVFRF